MVRFNQALTRARTKRLPFLFLFLACVLLGSTANSASMPSDFREVHLLNRLAFGPRPGDIERLKSIGTEQYIKEQLTPTSISLPDSLTAKLNSLSTLRLRAPELFTEYGPPSVTAQKGDKEAAQRARQRARVIVEQATEARLVGAVESPRQLEEVMVNFWFNHFNVFAQKGLDYLWIGSFEEQAIRPYAMGHFRDLLSATAKHPAMLFYLDNWQNTAPGSPGARGQFKGLNENYARELMELHTLGVDGGYTQDDVITLARILTGWGFRRPGQPLQALRELRGGNLFETNGFFFDSNRHDFSSKVFLGRTIRSSGIREGEEAIDILAAHPSTARHISYELAQYFVSDDPPKSLVDRLSKEFLDSRGDIRSVLNTLFHSPEFWDEQYFGKKFKTPYEYVISAVRVSGYPITNIRPLLGMMGQLGMPLYGCLTPDGYKNTQVAWLNPNAMTQRVNYAVALASGRLPLNQSPIDTTGQTENGQRMPNGNQAIPLEPIDAATLARTLGNALSAEIRASVRESKPQFRAALILGSPDFMGR